MFEGFTSFVDYLKYWGTMIIEMFARIKKWMEENFPTTTTTKKPEEDGNQGE